MPLDIPKYLPRAFKTQPAEGGIAKIDDYSAPNPEFPMLLFKAGNDPEDLTSRAIQIAIRTNEMISEDRKTADLKVGVFHIPFPEILKYGAAGFLRNNEMFDRPELIAAVAQCTADFPDMYDCVPPFDCSPPCQSPQRFFDLVDENHDPTYLDGAWFVLVGSIQSQGTPLSPGTTISGEIALLLKTES
jgi:hypothetical protein